MSSQPHPPPKQCTRHPWFHRPGIEIPDYHRPGPPGGPAVTHDVTAGRPFPKQTHHLVFRGHKMKRTRRNALYMKLFKTMLLTKRNEILGNISELRQGVLRPETANGPRMPIHPAEAGANYYDLENTMGLVENERQILKDIDRALECFEQSNYGRCEACKKLISLKRLEAIPWARLCVRCASIADKSKPLFPKSSIRIRRMLH